MAGEKLAVVIGLGIEKGRKKKKEMKEFEITKKIFFLAIGTCLWHHGVSWTLQPKTYSSCFDHVQHFLFDLHAELSPLN